MLTIEVRLRAAGSSSLSERRRWGAALLTMFLGVVVPVTASRAQDATHRGLIPGIVAIEGGDSVSITAGAASITLNKNGTIVLKGTDVIFEDGKPRPKPASRASEVF